MKKGQILYTWVLIIALLFFVLSASVAVPLFFRPFYYAHIPALHLEETSGHTAQQIREAYDEMMNFCMKGKPFGTGVFRWSEEGKAHFADCAALFLLDIKVLSLSSSVLVLCLPVYVFGCRPKKILGRGPMFWAGSILAGGFLVIAGLVSLDFDRAFIIFHQLFFAGKDNWLFDPYYDEIINVLPEIFFRNCAILIAGNLFTLCAAFMAADVIAGRRSSRRKL